MNFEPLFQIIDEAMAQITDSRFFKSERGYQGEFLAEIKTRLAKAGLPNNPIIEQEYQKRALVHGTNIRPDLIIHVPFERDQATNAQQGNFMAIELKLQATKKTATEAFESLALLKEKLDYPLTVFININSKETYSHLCPPSIAKQTKCYAAKLISGKVETICS